MSKDAEEAAALELFKNIGLDESVAKWVSLIIIKII